MVRLSFATPDSPQRTAKPSSVSAQVEGSGTTAPASQTKLPPPPPPPAPFGTPSGPPAPPTTMAKTVPLSSVT